MAPGIKPKPRDGNRASGIGVQTAISTRSARARSRACPAVRVRGTGRRGDGELSVCGCYQSCNCAINGPETVGGIATWLATAGNKGEKCILDTIRCPRTSVSDRVKSRSSSAYAPAWCQSAQSRKMSALWANEQPQYSHSTVTAQSQHRRQHGHSTVTAQSQHSHSTVTAQSQHSRSTVAAQSQHGHSTATARPPHLVGNEPRLLVRQRVLGTVGLKGDDMKDGHRGIFKISNGIARFSKAGGENAPSRRVGGGWCGGWCT